ncbi:MAG: hypothetical protein E7513_02760 [Ruminococcaceae bacterium]|nr:hypothetical protein [Oscillospiraceae bacterium]
MDKSQKKQQLIKTVVLMFALLVLVVVFVLINKSNTDKIAVSTQKKDAQQYSAYMIASMPVLAQEELSSGCEVYAATVVMQYLGFKINEFDFADKYLIKKPISYSLDYYRFGPDMNSAYAGDAYEGYGIYAPAMAKSMNSYLETTDTKMRAYDLKNIALDTLCSEYVVNDIPVMVWATTYMMEPYEKAKWTIDYVDENADSEIGDTEVWLQNEHCLVLMGFDKDNYYFCDSVSGEVSMYDKEVTNERYAQLGSQAIVIK